MQLQMVTYATIFEFWMISNHLNEYSLTTCSFFILKDVLLCLVLCKYIVVYTSPCTYICVTQTVIEKTNFLMQNQKNLTKNALKPLTWGELKFEKNYLFLLVHKKPKSQKWIFFLVFFCVEFLCKVVKLIRKINYSLHCTSIFLHK